MWVPCSIAPAQDRSPFIRVTSTSRNQHIVWMVLCKPSRTQRSSFFEASEGPWGKMLKGPHLHDGKGKVSSHSSQSLLQPCTRPRHACLWYVHTWNTPSQGWTVNEVTMSNVLQPQTVTLCRDSTIFAPALPGLKFQRALVFGTRNICTRHWRAYRTFCL